MNIAKTAEEGVHPFLDLEETDTPPLPDEEAEPMGEVLHFSVTRWERSQSRKTSDGRVITITPNPKRREGGWYDPVISGAEDAYVWQMDVSRNCVGTKVWTMRICVNSVPAKINPVLAMML